MSGSRFVLLSRRTADASTDVVTEPVTWLLVSSNSRPLGRAVRWFGDVPQCRADIDAIRDRRDQLTVVLSVVKGSGQWQWRIDCDRVPVAISSRTYLRQHESDYNVRRFMEALPGAEIMTTLRIVGGVKP